jgi:exodeoxyribonuclease V alpha subunit
MNGTILRLRDHNEDDEVPIVEADGIIVQLPEVEAPKLQSPTPARSARARALNSPVAIVIAHAAAGAYFLRREMLYTAMTRARPATLIVGQAAVVARAAATPDTSRRYSRLGERLSSPER